MKILRGLSFLFLAIGCASFESKFTSHVGCAEEDVKVIKRSHNVFGHQNYTVSCKDMVYHCTEAFGGNFTAKQDLRCQKAQTSPKVSNKHKSKNL